MTGKRLVLRTQLITFIHPYFFNKYSLSFRCSADIFLSKIGTYGVKVKDNTLLCELGYSKTWAGFFYVTKKLRSK